MSPRWPLGTKDSVRIVSVCPSFIEMIHEGRSTTIANGSQHLVQPRPGQLCTIERMDPGGGEPLYWRIIAIENSQ